MTQYTPEKKYYDNYTINNHQVSCLVGDTSEGRHKKLCDALSAIKGEASYNHSRFEKLHNEFKCSSSYHLTKSTSDNKPMPNCSDQIYSTLAQKFYDTSKAVSELSDLVKDSNYHTYQASAKAKDVAIKATDLCNFAKLNTIQVNAAFEKAEYDTNAAAYATVFTGILLPWLGLASVAANSLYNNEFTGKAERAHEAADTLVTKLAEVSSDYMY